MIQMWLLTRKFGFDPPNGSHQLPVFLKYFVRLKLLAQLVHMWECKTFAARLGISFLCVVCNEGSKNVWLHLQKPQMIIYAILQSSRVRHQYGIFGGKSQTSFTRNATRTGSEEGRLFSQATSGPKFRWWFCQSTFCCQRFGLCARRFSRQYVVPDSHSLAFSRSLAAYALVVSPTYKCGLIFKTTFLAWCLFFFGVKWSFDFVRNFRKTSAISESSRFFSSWDSNISEFPLDSFFPTRFVSSGTTNGCVRRFLVSVTTRIASAAFWPGSASPPGIVFAFLCLNPRGQS